MPGERARFRRHAFLETTIARQTKNMLVENAMLAGVEMCLRHFRCHCHTNRVAHALPQRTGGAFDSRRFKIFRMSRRFRMQLTKTLNVLDRNVVAAQVQPGIQEHPAMPGGKNEIVALDPARLFWIMSEHVTVKDRAYFCASQRQTKMA